MCCSCGAPPGCLPPRPQPAPGRLQIERPPRRALDMLPPQQLPHVDVFIVCYMEPVEVIEPTGEGGGAGAAWPAWRPGVVGWVGGGSRS